LKSTNLFLLSLFCVVLSACEKQSLVTVQTVQKVETKVPASIDTSNRSPCMRTKTCTIQQIIAETKAEQEAKAKENK